MDEKWMKICRICELDLDIENNPRSVTKTTKNGQKTLKLASLKIGDGKFSHLDFSDVDDDTPHVIWLHKVCSFNYKRHVWFRGMRNDELVQNANNPIELGIKQESESIGTKFDYKSLCILCGDDASDVYHFRELQKAQEQRNKVVIIQRKRPQEVIKLIVSNLSDEEMKERILNQDLLAVKARYHERCFTAFGCDTEMENQKKKLYVKVKKTKKCPYNELELRNPDFNFEKLCCFCGSEVKRRQYYQVVFVTDQKDVAMIQRVLYKYDSKWNVMVEELLKDKDLVALKARYHKKCRVLFNGQRFSQEAKLLLLKDRQDESADEFKEFDIETLPLDDQNDSSVPVSSASRKSRKDESIDELKDFDIETLPLDDHKEEPNSDGDENLEATIDINIDAEYTELACVACLSKNRTLIKLIQYRETFQTICSFTDISERNSYVCWECLAVLRKVKEFQQKVKMAHKIIADIDSKINFNGSLSKLTITKLDEVCFSPENDKANTENFATTNEINATNDVESVEFVDKLSSDENMQNPDEQNDIDIGNVSKTDYSGHKDSVSDNEHRKNLANEESGCSDDENDNGYNANETSDSDENQSGIDSSLDDQGTERSRVKPVKKKQVKDKDSDYEPDLAELRQLEGGIKSQQYRTKGQKTRELKKPRKYRLQDGTKTFVKVVKRVKIEPEDVFDWKEKEKNSDYYIKLRWKCDLCVSKISGSVHEHTRIFHAPNKEGDIPCDVCGQYVPRDAMSTHLSTHYFVFKCGRCGYLCWSLYHMRHHVRIHKIVECIECGDDFPNVKSFSEHYKFTHKHPRCQECGKKCRDKNKLDLHIERNHSIQKCTTCNKTFKNYQRKKDHMKLFHTVQQNEASYCVTCDRQFLNEAQYKVHLYATKVHALESGRYRLPQRAKCPACPNTYAKKSAMKNHYNKVHKNEKRHYCNTCDLNFLSNYLLKRHNMYKHQGMEKPRNKICDYCGRGFTVRKILENHIRTHTGEKPFKCPHCDASFAQKVAMYSHVKHIHKGLPRTYKKEEHNVETSNRNKEQR